MRWPTHNEQPLNVLYRAQKNPPKRVFYIDRFSPCLQLGEALFDDCQAFVQLRIRRSQRNQYAQHVAVRAAGQQDQALLTRLGHHGGDGFAAIQQVLFFEHFQHGQGRGASDRATGIGAAQATWRDGVHVFGLAAHTGQRETASDGFSEGGQVGSHAHLFHGEERTGTAGTGLHFVGDQQDAVLVAQFTQALHEGFRRDVETAFALHWLDDDGSDITRLGIVLEDAFDAGDGVVVAHAMQVVREQRAEDAAWHQAHAGRVRHDFTGEAQGHHGATVVRAGERDNAGTASGGAGDFHGVLNGFGTGGDQQGFLGEITWDLGVDFFAQFHVRLVGQYLEAGVGQLVQLLGHGRDDFRVYVTGVQHGDTAGEVDELATFNVGHSGVLRGFGEDRVNLANTAWYSGFAAFHQRSVGLAHKVLIRHSSGGVVQGIRGGEATRAACDDRLPQRSRPLRITM